ncbi:ATP-binding protein [Allochromatium palmeri]|uniref:AAA family ATPase n=1 Tax=Allochromatium palmeri TaxID=231048 RepID=A0A6N8EDG7_9GAMM|nr:ATP-binding protein [Allochromatium palmeri]MTW21641.1 AAA family ATPase [Allochromatium palmeri]
MTARKLPIGLQTFSEIIEQGYAYVDKTAHAWAMASQGKSYFLSRPRRFGKSLFLDTLKELFEGSEALFRGLYIHERWDWSRRHPVIRFDFSAGVLRNREELDQRIDWLLRDNARRLGLIEAERDTDIPGRFAGLIQGARAATGQSVVILVDEYDKPILDNITDPTGAAAEIREGLKNLYSVMKGHDADIRFVFMTGVTKFSKVSLFSGLNQLEDLTLDERFATLCGYTQSDLETTFGEHLRGVDWARLKQWYNGYGFLGEPVYNPFDILLFIAKGQRFRPYWFETGNPSFLIELLRARQTFLPSLEGIEASEEILDSFDIERVDPVTLLFQTGYLTIDSTRWRRSRLLYRLRLPNQEVKMALADHLIDAYLGTLASGRDARQDALYDCLRQGDVDGLIEAIRRLFAGIPWRNFTGNDLPESEGYYASVLYAFFVSLNAEIIPEDISNHGQVDLTVKLEGYVYVIEIKLQRGSRPARLSSGGTVHSDAETQAKPKGRQSRKTDDATPTGEPANPALAQIRARDYSAKYRGLSNKGLFELGLVFDSQARNLAQADWRADHHNAS